MNNLIQLNYNGSEIRTIDDNGQIWWVLKDVCNVLGISHIKDTVKRLDEDEVGQTEVVDSLGRKQKSYVVNESGIYSVILRSDKPEAKPFRRWITHEVLPEIRRTGSYSLTSSQKKNKTWYGVPVLTVADIAQYLGTSRDAARKKIIANLRNGLDYFVLSGYSLQLFKFENRDISVMATHLLLIKQDAFMEYLNK
ncbi:BRO-N domain-containing protein [Porcipelethomonas sp.]|uniref:BRO-N domain-containing protein n=1 Tax=Porcipelethomonas sp. TaxID=2981675 RepID=UPI003EF25D54